jgi:hypothetical protein
MAGGSILDFIVMLISTFVLSKMSSYCGWGGGGFIWVFPSKFCRGFLF